MKPENTHSSRESSSRSERALESWLARLALHAASILEEGGGPVAIAAAQDPDTPDTYKEMRQSGEYASPALWLDSGVLRSACVGWQLGWMGCCIAGAGDDGPVMAGAALAGDANRPVLLADAGCQTLSLTIARELLAAERLLSVSVEAALSQSEGHPTEGSELWDKATELANRAMRRTWGPMRGGCQQDCVLCSPAG